MAEIYGNRIGVRGFTLRKLETIDEIGERGALTAASGVGGTIEVPRVACKAEDTSLRKLWVQPESPEPQIEENTWA